MKPRKKEGGLVLSRRKKETVVLSKVDMRIVVTVLDVEGNRVKLHFTAPPEVKIVRGEIEGEE